MMEQAIVKENMSIKEYHDDREYLSASTIKAGLESMKALKWKLDNRDEYVRKRHFDFGNAFERALTDIDNFDADVAVWKDLEMVNKALADKPDLKVPRSSKLYKDEKSLFEAENEDKYIVNDYGPESMETIGEMVLACQSNKTINAMLSGIELQKSIFWTDPVSGLKLKTRPDVNKASGGAIIDIKTTRRTPSPANAANDISDFAYWLQACIQIKGCQAAGLLKVQPNYFWLLVEKNEPYHAQLYEFSHEDQITCMEKTNDLLKRIAQAIRDNHFPGYEWEADNKFGILTAKIW